MPRVPVLLALLVAGACLPEPPGSDRPDSAVPTVAAAAVATPGTDVSACGLDAGFTHASRHDGARTILTGAGGALAFRSRYAVNTDGAATSYHPDDPAGNLGLAINTICNGANAVLPSGERLDWRQCPRLLAAFREARDAGWTAPGTPRIDFFAVATRPDPAGSGRRLPCTVTDGPHAGWFVSTTSLAADPSRGACDPARYLDALAAAFIIRPGAAAFARAGMEIGDLAVVYHPPSGRRVFAVVGDTGPADGLGEGSVAIGRALGGRAGLPRTRAETYAFGLGDAVTLVLPGRGPGPPFTQARIDATGAAAFAAFGGDARLAACAAALAPP